MTTQESHGIRPDSDEPTADGAGTVDLDRHLAAIAHQAPATDDPAARTKRRVTAALAVVSLGFAGSVGLVATFGSGTSGGSADDPAASSAAADANRSELLEDLSTGPAPESRTDRPTAEDNRFPTLSELNRRPAWTAGFRRAEINRFEAMRDVGWHRHHEPFLRAETNRFEALRDLSAAPLNTPFDTRADTNRFEILRDLRTTG